MATQERFCEKCGAANTSIARFCQYCSAPLPFQHTTGTLPEETLINGRYQLEVRIGQGGMGAVYKAFDTRFNNRSIAVKINSSNSAIVSLRKLDEAASQRSIRQKTCTSIRAWLLSRR